MTGALALAVVSACGRPTCPAGDLDCLAGSFSIVDFDHFDDPKQREKLTVVDGAKLGALAQSPDGGLSVKALGNAELSYSKPDEGDLLSLEWLDSFACRPAFCYSHCPRGMRCMAPARCTPSRADGLRHATTMHWVEYAKTPEQTTDMDLVVTPVAAPGCPADVGALINDGTGGLTAGPPTVVRVHLPGAKEDTPAGGGGSGPCGTGLHASTASCTPLGTSGVTDTCISPSEYQSVAGQPLPAACNAQGSGGCLDTQRGILVKPCCPGLTCRVGTACGGSSTVGGLCL